MYKIKQPMRITDTPESSYIAGEESHSSLYPSHQLDASRILPKPSVHYTLSRAWKKKKKKKGRRKAHVLRQEKTTGPMTTRTYKGIDCSDICTIPKPTMT